MQWLGLLIVMVLSLTLVAWLTLHWGLLPRIEQWRPLIEARATAAIGQPVRIGRIVVRSHGWVPSFTLSDVRLLDAQGRTALRLGEVQAAVSPQALLALELRFSQLHVDGVQLDVRRDAKGRIRVAGLDTEAAASDAQDDGRAADWLLSQHEIVIRRGSVRWTDELRAAPALELAGVDLVLRNSLRRHELRLDATPPADWGERFTVIGQFTHGFLRKRSQWRHWSGTLFAQLPAGDVSRLRQHVSLPFELADGRGALRTWIDVDRGEWREVMVDLALADVQARLASHLQPLAVASLTGRVKAARQADGVQISGQQLQLVTREGVEWPLGDVALEWRQKQALTEQAVPGPVTGGRFRADRLDLGVLGSLAARLPLGRAMELTLQNLSPGGVVHALDLRWTGSPDDPQRYEATGRVSRLVLAPLASPQPQGIGRPGLAGADIDFTLSETGGKATLAMQQGALHFPGVFEDPAIPMTQLQARLEWRIQRRPQAPPALEVHVSDARFGNDDGQGSLQATWRTGKGTGFGQGGYLPGEIDLNGRMSQLQAQRVAAYLPMGIPAAVRHYVGRAVKGGRIDEGSYVVKGDVWAVPFHRAGEGVFRVAGRLSDAQIDYLPSVLPGGNEPAWNSPWPGLAQVSGNLLFERTSMTLDQLQGRLWGTQLRNVQVRIDELGEQAVLRVDGEGRGPVADVLRFVEVSPVGQWIGGGMSTISATGVGDLKLGLSIPLLQPEKTQVTGSVTLAGSDVQIRPDLPTLAGARGRIDFSHKGFQIVGASARALGGELTLEGGTQADGPMRFQAQGTATAEGLRRAVEFAPLPMVAQQLRGQTSWRAVIALPQGRPEVSVSSDLVGMASDWPAPLGKPAAVALPLRWNSASLPGTQRPGEAPRDQMRLDLGSLLQLRLQREGMGDNARIASASVGLGESAPGAIPGTLQVRGRLARLDADAWSRAMDKLVAPGEAVPGWPRLQAGVQVQELQIGARRITQATLDVQQESPGVDSPWQVQVAADQLAGHITWRAPRGPADAGRLTARLERFSLPPAEVQQVEQLLEAGPTLLPALDIAVEDFELRGRKFGRLNLQAAGRPGAGSRDWRLDRLELELPDAKLSASGLWSAPERPGVAGRMNLDFGVALADTGHLATHFGWVNSVRGGKGELKGRIAWIGSPLSPDLAQMDGSMSVRLAAGQFLKAEPGLGRLLGIVSLQSLPRRLLLDFRDVFQQGFAFDQISGDIALARGQAHTDNLRMRGVQATVFIEGQADLVREQQDLRVLIVPEINAGAASLAYLAVNPAIGLGTFFAQMLLRDPLRAASTREFAVTGSMAEPKVERVERALNAPLPGDGPSAPASSPAAAPASAPRGAATPTPAQAPQAPPVPSTPGPERPA